MSSDAVASQRSDVPDLLGVPEAAALLRVGLTFAYESTARYIATGTETEIPAIKVGRLTRVPRVAFERYRGAPITGPIPVVEFAVARISAGCIAFRFPRSPPVRGLRACSCSFVVPAGFVVSDRCPREIG